MVMVKIQKVTPDLSIKRSVDSGTEEQLRAVKDIIAKVKKEGDKALRELTARFDGANSTVLPSRKRKSGKRTKNWMKKLSPSFAKRPTISAAFMKNRGKNPGLQRKKTGRSSGKKLPRLTPPASMYRGGRPLILLPC